MIYLVLSALINFLEVAILLHALLSWFPIPQNYMGVVRALDGIVQPILEPIQKVLYRYLNLGSIDISPVVALLLLSVIKRMLFFIL